ncbi:MAG: hypothetical protein ACSHX8_08515 [Opitutaceae bacterium]
MNFQFSEHFSILQKNWISSFQNTFQRTLRNPLEFFKTTLIFKIDVFKSKLKFFNSLFTSQLELPRVLSKILKISFLSLPENFLKAFQNRDQKFSQEIQNAMQQASGATPELVPNPENDKLGDFKYLTLNYPIFEPKRQVGDTPQQQIVPLRQVGDTTDCANRTSTKMTQSVNNGQNSAGIKPAKTTFNALYTRALAKGQPWAYGRRSSSDLPISVKNMAKISIFMPRKCLANLTLQK